jgi:hypothetical protein
MASFWFWVAEFVDVPLPNDCTTSPWPLVQVFLPFTVWQATPSDPAQLRLPFTDWQRSDSAEAGAMHHKTETIANAAVRA